MENNTPRTRIARIEFDRDTAARIHQFKAEKRRGSFKNAVEELVHLGLASIKIRPSGGVPPAPPEPTAAA